MPEKREITKTVLEAVELTSAGESIYTDGDEIFLWRVGGPSADVDEVLSLARHVDQFGGEYEVGDLRVERRASSKEGNVYLIDASPKGAGRQSTCIEEIEAAVEMAREHDE